MQITPYVTVFAAVFVAEPGDKTQSATLLFAGDRQMHSIGVFIAAATALVASTAIAVPAGVYAEKHPAAALY